MFGKKKDENGSEKHKTDGAEGRNMSEEEKDMDSGSAPPLKPFSRRGSHAPAKPPSSPGHTPDYQRRSPDIPGSPARRLDRPRAGEVESRRLIVGRDIELSGEITECDKLVVEGHVEIKLPGARVLEVAPSGFFKGDAEVDEADISGRFEGDLTARERLIVRSGGRVNGTVRYGRIVIESGGEIAGDMRTLDSSEESSDSPETPDGDKADRDA